MRHERWRERQHGDGCGQDARSGTASGAIGERPLDLPLPLSSSGCPPSHRTSFNEQAACLSCGLMLVLHRARSQQCLSKQLRVRTPSPIERARLAVALTSPLSLITLPSLPCATRHSEASLAHVALVSLFCRCVGLNTSERGDTASKGQNREWPFAGLSQEAQNWGAPYHVFEQAHDPPTHLGSYPAPPCTRLARWWQAGNGSGPRERALEARPAAHVRSAEQWHDGGHGSVCETGQQS